MPTKIEWTNETWNPVTGCDKVSPGCKHCYMFPLAERLQRMGHPKYKNGARLTLQPDYLDEPLRWKKPRKIFVNSMSDLFHEKIPEAFIRQVFDVMVRCPQHTFQILTKRAERLAELAPRLPWPANVWQGVSVEDRKYGLPRIPYLVTVQTWRRILSVEPLLEDLGPLPLDGIHQVIVGGESGYCNGQRRRIDPDWVRPIREQCQRAGVAFFFKQWGGHTPKAGGRLLDGRTWDEYPLP
jgi:protein gp37